MKYLWEEVKDQDNKINKTTSGFLTVGSARLQTHTLLSSEKMEEYDY